tara:strand:- start:974 stop:1516 length:543 start_codon:yes stop_codon:yes gene_type:complete
MNDFKLIMENWRHYAKEEKVEEILGLSSKEKIDKAIADLPAVERPGIETVGDLKKFLKLAKAKEIGGEIGKEALGLLAGMVPGGTTVLDTITGAKDVASLVKSLFKAEDDYNTGTKLDALNVDDNVSAIVDDPIEVNFIRYLVKNVLANAPDDESLENYNTTELLQQFIAKKFDNVTVKK